MKTICIMDSVSRANGGIFEAERCLQQNLQTLPNLSVQVIGLQDVHTAADRNKWLPLQPLTLRVLGPAAIGYAPGFFPALMQAQADLAYCVGLWKYPSLAALRWSRRTRRPMIVAPHGMLDPWALRNSQCKKKLAGWLFQTEQLKAAACIRALCAAEAQSIRALGLNNPIAIIPNGIGLPEKTGSPGHSGPPVWQSCLPPGRKVLLFLSRIHPKKGLVNLLKAWAQLQVPHSAGPAWTLAIAGWDQGGHETELKRLATELGLAWADVRDPQTNASRPWSVLFLGPQFNADKTAGYHHCDAFILPSFSEGLPMVILEAWAHGKPVLMTPECNLPEGYAAHAAIRIETSVAGIQQGLRALFQAGDGDLAEIGGCGRHLVATRFTWPNVAGDMRLVYDWLLARGPRPDCVV